MRIRFAETGGPLNGRVASHTTHAARSGLAVDCLSIPRARAVKAQYRVKEEVEPKYAALALHLYDMGLLSEQDRELVTITEILGKGLTRWFVGCMGETSQVNPIAGTIATSLDGALQSAYESSAADEGEPLYLLLAHTNNEAELCVGDVMMRLESILPGLGETIYAAIECASYRTVSAFTPNRALYEGQCLYWQGCESDEDLREELEANYGENWREEAEEQGIYWPSQYRASFKVPWVLAAKAQVPERKLKKLARRHPLAWVRKLCRLTLAMQALSSRNAMIEGPQQFLDAETVYPSVVLRWDEQDDLKRVLDDYIERANECSDCYTDVVSVMEVPLEKEDFMRWEQQTSPGLRLYQLLDAALDVVSEQNQEIKHDD